MLRCAIVCLVCLAWACFSSAIGGEPEGHWAFQPLRDVAPPEIEDSWIRTPIDAFILERLQEENLAPASPAPPRDFIRRAHVALTGFPPDYADIAGWLGSREVPDGVLVDQLVDHLLASPQFGVRWGRHWLDVARYSDTKGYAYAVEQSDFFHAWPYRDWVVDAFNADLPYDKFIELQMAADRLLAEGQCETRDLAAMGFLTLGRRFLGVEQDIIDDRIDVVTRGLLGLTAACARCHDHKFDPIPTADYYALYGIFKSSRERLVPLTPDLPNDPELAKLQDELIAVFNNEADAVEKTFLARVDAYLSAALDLSNVPRPAFTEIVLPDAVNPAQIRRWHEYLAQSARARDPVFAPWKALANATPATFQAVLKSLRHERSGMHSLVLQRLAEQPPASMEDVAILYASILQQAADETNTGTEWDTIRAVMRAPDSPLLIAREHPHDIEWLFHNSALEAVKGAFAKVERRIVALNEQAPFTVALEDRPVPQNMRILLRGDYCTQGDEAPRAGLSLLGGVSAGNVDEGSGRLELARSITAPANPLTARVIVNRIWHDYFGTGLVKTTSDFGLRADPPSHPELLDYLAQRLIENDWSLKSIHRLIATSAVFRQRAGVPGTVDPENRLLACFPRQRLEFESMRDALLVASGEMDLRLTGPPGPLLGAEASPRRSIFGKIDRQFLPTTLRVFDFANPELHSPGRYETNVPQQALFFLNSPFTIQRARALVRTLSESSPEARVRRMFAAVYQRDPTPEQLAASLEYVRDAAPAPDATLTATTRAWHYGFGEVNEVSNAVTGFTELPHFDGTQWSGGADWPDAQMGWVRLTADGGHAGNSVDHAAVRRWIAPVDAIIQIHGAVAMLQDCGDGVRAFVCSEKSTIDAWQVEFGATTQTNVERVSVVAGGAIDFVVDCGASGEFSCDGFRWKIQIEQLDADGGVVHTWDSSQDFGGDVRKPEPLTEWERLAQALMLSNEFIFVD